MQSNKFLKLLCSTPVILIFLYFIPFLGICLFIARYIIFKKTKGISCLKWLIAISVLILIPRLAFEILKLIKVQIDFIDLNAIINSEIYLNLIGYGKFLLTFSIIAFILLIIIDNIISKTKTKINSNVTSYIRKQQQMEREVAKENDLKIKQQQEKAKNTNYISCPNCGADNIIIGKVGVCKYCRSAIEKK